MGLHYLDVEADYISGYSVDKHPRARLQVRGRYYDKGTGVGG